MNWEVVMFCFKVPIFKFSGVTEKKNESISWRSLASGQRTELGNFGKRSRNVKKSTANFVKCNMDIIQPTVREEITVPITGKRNSFQHIGCVGLVINCTCQLSLLSLHFAWGSSTNRVSFSQRCSYGFSGNSAEHSVYRTTAFSSDLTRKSRYVIYPCHPKTQLFCTKRRPPCSAVCLKRNPEGDVNFSA
jgi:hypothetical protein